MMHCELRRTSCLQAAAAGAAPAPGEADLQPAPALTLAAAGSAAPAPAAPGPRAAPAAPSEPQLQACPVSPSCKPKPSARGQVLLGSHLLGQLLHRHTARELLPQNCSPVCLHRGSSARRLLCAAQGPAALFARRLGSLPPPLHGCLQLVLCAGAGRQAAHARSWAESPAASLQLVLAQPAGPMEAADAQAPGDLSAGKRVTWSPLGCARHQLQSNAQWGHGGSLLALHSPLLGKPGTACLQSCCCHTGCRDLLSLCMRTPSACLVLQQPRQRHSSRAVPSRVLLCVQASWTL